MMARRTWWVSGGLFVVVILMTANAPAQDKKDKLDLDKIPKKVMDTLKAKFPKAEIQMWTMEKEGDKVMYDIEFKQGTQKFEADIFEDGTIHNWEKEIAAKDLPDAVRKTLDKRYPKATLKEIMQITAVVDKKEMRECYEIVVEAAYNKEQEITISPDGKVLEDTGEKK
jgi:hypothetical protein